jgi:hypothetical protein
MAAYYKAGSWRGRRQAPLRTVSSASAAPPCSAALTARADYCALVPDLDAAHVEHFDFVRGNVQVQLSKLLRQRSYRELIDDPACSDQDRAVGRCRTQPGALTGSTSSPAAANNGPRVFPPSIPALDPHLPAWLPMSLFSRDLNVWGDHAVQCTFYGEEGGMWQLSVGITPSQRPRCGPWPLPLLVSMSPRRRIF